jgi:hypothetical protein
MTVAIRCDEERHNRCGLLPVQNGSNASGDGTQRSRQYTDRDGDIC